MKVMILGMLTFSMYLAYRMPLELSPVLSEFLLAVSSIRGSPALALYQFQSTSGTTRSHLAARSQLELGQVQFQQSRLDKIDQMMAPLPMARTRIIRLAACLQHKNKDSANSVL